jgi:hemerythrin superfamily protein
MDAITAITNDHRLLEKLFDKLKHDSGERRSLLAEVRARLMAHNAAEEERVYPALKRADPSESGDVHHGVKEHREALEKLAALEQAGSDDEFSAALDEFVGAVKHHVEEEESDILPALRDAVTAKELDQLGRDFEESRLAELEALGDFPSNA